MIMVTFLGLIFLFILAIPFALKAWWDCGGLGNTLELHRRLHPYPPLKHPEWEEDFKNDPLNELLNKL
jgi:hypothetical protein